MASMSNKCSKSIEKKTERQERAPMLAKGSKVDKYGPKQAKKGQPIGKKLQLIKKEFNMHVKK